MSETPLRIDALTTQAEGIGRVEGKAVFVPFTLPGESWNVSVLERKAKYERALPAGPIQSEPHPERIDPPCPYYGECGGCQLQHVAYEHQLELKRQWIVETFRRIGHMDVECQPVTPSPPWEYRNKLSLPMRQQEDRIRFYYHRIYRPDDWIEVEDCAIAHAKIRSALKPLAEALEDCQARLGVNNGKSEDWARAMFRVVDERLHVFLNGVFVPRPLQSTLVQRLLVADTPIDALHWETKTYVREGISDVNPADDAFQQVNDRVRDEIYTHVAGLDFAGGESLLEGYCGRGILTGLLARRFAHVIGVEADEAAAKAAKRARSADEQVAIYSQSMEAFLRQNAEWFDAIVLNPPRAGLSKPVRQSLQRRQPTDLVMVSCHPAALVRDAAALIESGYEICSLKPFDMFPQTWHTEAVLHLRRRFG